MDYEDVIAKVQAFSKRVAERYHPKLIILYGSYARGTATENSDIDIAVFCDTLPGDHLENAAGLFRLTRDIDLRIEPILIEADTANGRFYQDILKTGKIVYTASA
ncbi:MAG: nucleotidyltransferase domain-containing protein [Phycisphaerae bacterium]|nr:nucleotidyltransferase domain-containing protein [Phycisphaerae bacterium]